MKWILKTALAFSIISTMVFSGDGKNVKVDLGFSGFYEPANSFTAQGGLYGNPAALILDQNSSITINAALPFGINSETLKGNGVIGKLFKLDNDVDKIINDSLQQQKEDQISKTTDGSFKIEDLEITEANSDVAVGVMPSINGVTAVYKDKDISVGLGFEKSSLKLDFMINNIGASMSGAADIGGTSTPLDANISLNANNKLNAEYQKVSLGVAKELGFLGATIGAGIDYHSLYVDINEKMEGRLKLQINGKTPDDDIVVNVNNVYKNELTMPVYKAGIIFNWNIIKFGANYNRYAGGELERYLDKTNMNAVNSGFKSKLNEFFNDKDEMQFTSAEIGDIVTQVNDILGNIFEKQAPEIYKGQFKDNSSMKLSGMLDLGWFCNVGVDVEKYSSPLWEFELSEDVLKNDAKSLEGFGFTAGKYKMDTVFKMYSKLLFLNGSVNLASIEGPVTKLIPTNGSLNAEFSLGNYDFTIGLTTTQIKYNF